MTVMFPRYFGLPQAVIRSRIWRGMKPSEQSFYVFLCHESERKASREVRRTDAEIRDWTGLSSRALSRARKKVQEIGLALCHRAKGNVYIYTLCNPETGRPWEGDPKTPVRYERVDGDGHGVPSSALPPPSESKPQPPARLASRSDHTTVIEARGLPGVF